MLHMNRIKRAFQNTESSASPPAWLPQYCARKKAVVALFGFLENARAPLVLTKYKKSSERSNTQ